jgi:hypothetical protein
MPTGGSARTNLEQSELIEAQEELSGYARSALARARLQEVAEGRAEVGRVAHGVAHDLVDERVDAGGVEGRLPDRQLVQDHAQAPQVGLRA